MGVFEAGAPLKAAVSAIARGWATGTYCGSIEVAFASTGRSAPTILEGLLRGEGEAKT
jgi:hypothetical protein